MRHRKKLKEYRIREDVWLELEQDYKHIESSDLTSLSLSAIDNQVSSLFEAYTNKLAFHLNHLTLLSNLPELYASNKLDSEIADSLRRIYIFQTTVQRHQFKRLPNTQKQFRKSVIKRFFPELFNYYFYLSLALANDFIVNHFFNSINQTIIDHSEFWLQDIQLNGQLKKIISPSPAKASFLKQLQKAIRKNRPVIVCQYKSPQNYCDFTLGIVTHLLIKDDGYQVSIKEPDSTKTDLLTNENEDLVFIVEKINSFLALWNWIMYFFKKTYVPV